MKRRDISRKLVQQLEKKAMTFTQIQECVFKISNNINMKEKVKVSRGYWSNNLTQLFNSLTIGKHPEYGYFALPGTSKKERMFAKEVHPWSMQRNKNKLHLEAIKHPGIRKKIEKEDKLHNYI